MTLSVIAALAILVGLQLKHFLFDFVFQSDWQVANKGTYGHPGGLAHSGLQSAGTLVVLLTLVIVGQLPLQIAMAIAALDFVIHYHVDWAKSQISRNLDVRPKTKAYWVAFGLDQLAHQLTYVGLVALLTALI